MTDDSLITEPVSPEHTHTQGPLCFKASDTADHEPQMCGHDSCQRMIHEDCLECMREALAEAEEYHERIVAINELMCGARQCDITLCPCGDICRFTGHYGAPGIGQHWQCDNETPHHWSFVDGTFYPAEDGMHLREPAYFV